MSNGISPEKELPTTWSASKNVLWRAPLFGAGVSQPIVVGDRVFVTASDGRKNDHLHLLCFDRHSGKQLWHAKFFGSAVSEGEFPPGGMAVPTPAGDTRRVYALFGTGDLVCVDFDGKPVWIRSLADSYGVFRNRWGMGSSPLLADGLLIVQVDHWGQSYLLAVDAETGRERWRTERDASVNWSSPVVAQEKGRTLIVVAGTYRVQGYELKTGRELWSVRGMQMQCIPTPIVDRGYVFAVSGRKGNNLAIRLDGAAGDVTDSHVIWNKTRGAPYVPSGLCYEGRYYLIDDGGMATCYEAATGQLLWQERVPGKYHASLVAGAGKIYVTNMDGVVTVLKSGPDFDVLAKNSIGEAVIAPPALAQGRIYLRTDKQLTCVGDQK